MITTDAAAIEARYGGKAAVSSEPPHQIPTGTPVPEGVIIEQRVGRAQAPPMAIVPPQVTQGPQPAIAVVPPTGAGRTGIGTFVEQTPTNRSGPPSNTPVSPSISNPLVASPPPINSGVAEPPVEQKAPKKERKLDLVQEILTHMHELGGWESEDCQRFYDRSPQSLKTYIKNPGAIPMECFLKFLAKRPGVAIRIAEELEPVFNVNGQEGSINIQPNRTKMDVVVCSPILGQPTLPFLWTLVWLARKYELGVDIQADTAIWRSRNMLAKRFLASGAAYSLWLDADIAIPIKNGDWFRWLTGATAIPDEYMRYDALERLLSHRKAFVAGVYAARKYHGQLVIQPEIRPRSQEDRLLCNDIRKGSARGIVEVDWLGFGCALVHREVFLEIQRRFPQLAPEAEFAPWRFFQPEGDEGEDEAFSKRAKACGVPLWLDTQLICCHIGNFGFLPEHTVPLPGI